MADERQAKRQASTARIVLPATIAGLIVFAALVVALNAVLPAQGYVGSSRNFGYACSGAKSASVEFNTTASSENSYLVFGSSELATSASRIGTVPANVFGTSDYGFDLTYIGEAYDQSLWHAIAAGAYAESAGNDKVILIISPTWFEDGGVDNDTFGLRFSYSLYSAFCSNESISEESKDYVARRLAEQGIDEATIQAARKELPQDYLNDAVLQAQDDLALRADLAELRDEGLNQAGREEPDMSFEELREEALAQAQAGSTNNSWGMEDAFYAENIEGRLDELKDMHADETYSDTPEYDDFTFFLKVCGEVGLEPLVVISPVQGDFFDLEGISTDVREYCYERVRSICENMDVEYADFSDREYEDYFLYDIVHFGWTGWVDVEEAIYDYVSE